MAQPIWQTPAGNLGIIREGVFFNLDLLATVEPYTTPAICTATTAGTNVITCDTTESMEVGRVITFYGTPFGNLELNTAYIIYSVIDSTHFQVKDSPVATAPLVLTTATGVLTGVVSDRVYYQRQAGTTPKGIQINGEGVCYGVPQVAVAVEGVPLDVPGDVTSKFAVRAYTLKSDGTVDGYMDRTFTLTVTGYTYIQWITPAGNIGTYYDADEVDIQLLYTEPEVGYVASVSLVSGEIPLGLKLDSSGRLHGYIRPYPNVASTPGYDLTPYQTSPYDIIVDAVNKNYQFTLEVYDGKSTAQRTFEIYVYDRTTLTADDTILTADNDIVTADETPLIAPFLVNAEPSDLGTVRSGNNFAYQFIGEDYYDNLFEYHFSVNHGYGVPPGLILDPYSGWYYGTLPPIGETQITYSFNIQVRARSLVIYSTNSGTNTIVCDSSTRGDFYVGSPVTFEGDVVGGLADDTTYYVESIVSDTEFTVSYTLGGAAVILSDATVSGLCLCVPAYSARSREYPFTLTISGIVENEVTWLTPSDLGSVENGSVSILDIKAESRSGIPLLYELKPGAYNKLPQGLTLLPTGEIAGRVSFEVFELDLGTTTFDASTTTISGVSGTTVDCTHTFTVVAYATEGQIPLYEISGVKVTNGGSGYTSAPAITFNTPTGAIAREAQATATVSGGSVTAVTVTDPGEGYTTTATYSLTGPGAGAVLEVLMQQTGYRRVISVEKTFTVRVLPVYRKPYQNLNIMAMPPQNDRDLLETLLTNTDIFVPEYIFRAPDPNFGVAQQVIYQHAFGLAPETLDTYVNSLQLSHYWKNLVLGEVKTARALDAEGNVIYEVVYSAIQDDLVNAQGESVQRIVTTPYAFNNPEPPPELINFVYPNSLINMRNQVIDVVGQISKKLPSWMTSRQTNGQILGFTPAWVICYTKPGRAEQIAYYLGEYFGQQLNTVDFQVDRYILDDTMSVNWNPATQSWNPPPVETTFDVDTEATTFDHGSVDWVEPIDQYNPTDTSDKYLVFPKVDILQ